jgi:F-type H+-transporting ATPase subunit delta
MFHAEPWAAAFINVYGNASEGLACLKALAAPLKPISARLFGLQAAKRLEKMLRESANDAGLSAGAATGAVSANAASANNTAEYAIRFICLMVKKNVFRRIDTVIERIEKRLDEQNGVLEMTAESAVPIDSAFEEDLKKMIAGRTGAAGIKMKTRVVPELLAGFRLRCGSFFVDASLKGQIERMTADLTTIAVE